MGAIVGRSVRTSEGLAVGDLLKESLGIADVLGLWLGVTEGASVAIGGKTSPTA